MAKEVESQRKGKQTKKFTNEAIQGWRHPKQGQELYWDSARQNVTLLIGKRTKTFRYHFRLNDHWISTKLGQFSKTFGVKEAYDKASEIDVKVAQGSYIRIRKRRGTRIEIQSHPAGPVDLTYEQVVKQFIELSAKLTQRKWKESERVLMNDFKDWLPRAFKSITKAEARTTIERFIADKKVGKAANARAWIRRLWRWAADRAAATGSLWPGAWPHRDRGTLRPWWVSPPPPPAASRPRSGPACPRPVASAAASGCLPGRVGPGPALRIPAPLRPAYSEHAYREPMDQGPAYPGPKYPGHAGAGLGTRAPHAALHRLCRPVANARAVYPPAGHPYPAGAGAGYSRAARRSMGSVTGMRQVKLRHT
jgi:hypothetical protein